MKKAVLVLIGMICVSSCNSCKKDEVEPVIIASMNVYGKYPPYEVSYWAVGGQQFRTVTTQNETIQFAWDKDFANNSNFVTSKSTFENDSLYMDMKVEGRYYAKGLAFKTALGVRRVGFNSNALK